MSDCDRRGCTHVGGSSTAHGACSRTCAEEVRGAYDVVSMHHYLEHTR